jgi:hypothetical protein
MRRMTLPVLVFGRSSMNWMACATVHYVELELEQVRGVKEIRSETEVSVLHDIIDLVGWPRDIRRAR